MGFITEKIVPLMLVGGIVLGINRCLPDSHEEYLFEGQIENENVRYHENIEPNRPFNTERVLEVVRQDGKKIEYISGWHGKQLIVDYILLQKGTNSMCYRRDLIGSKALEECQKQFDSYLVKILEARRNKALQDITAGFFTNKSVNISGGKNDK